MLGIHKYETAPYTNLYINYYNTSFSDHIFVYLQWNISLAISSIMNIGLWDVNLLYLLFNTVKHMLFLILLALLYLCHVLAQSNSSVKLGWPVKSATLWISHQMTAHVRAILGNSNFRFSSCLQFVWTWHKRTAAVSILK